MKNIIITLAIITALMWGLKIGAERQEIKDCYRWQSWAEQSKLFNPDEQMLATCERAGVKIK